MKVQYTISGVGDGITYGVYEQPEGLPPGVNATLISKHATLKAAQKACREYEETNKHDERNVR
jgi:hypothetical protein